MEEMRYAEVAEMLHRNLTLLWKKSTELSRELQKYQRQTEDQINKIHQFEVDIDIKVRACKGSCKQTFDHVPDHETFRSMRDKIATFDLTSPKQQKTFTLDKKLELQPVVQPHDSLAYGKLPFAHSELLTKMEDIEQNQVVMDELQQHTWNSDGEWET
ncbi:fibrinogen alpha chain [Ictalurus punctatus]|uniref:Fibrinogen alpha chain n=1 Tax=Ictalurus punctatus TaxID=7998 RepID=A0A9F7QXP1_ICTPU|nr:fibrinogen alpha chain [Ictalurus punctatus]